MFFVYISRSRKEDLRNRKKMRGGQVTSRVTSTVIAEETTHPRHASIIKKSAKNLGKTYRINDAGRGTESTHGLLTM
jgi:hypothetical protein